MAAVTLVYGWAAVAFSDGWQTAEPSWTDVTNHLREFSVSWGRSGEWSTFRSGTASAVFDVRDATLEASMWAANPWVPIKLGVTFTDGSSTTTACLFSGFVERWQFGYPQMGRDKTATIQASDGLKIPAMYETSVRLSSGKAGAMLTSALTDIGWVNSTHWRTLDTGGAALGKSASKTTQSAFTLMSKVAESDGGFLYSMPHPTFHTPRIVFRAADYPLLNNTVQCTFGETTAYTRYHDVDLVVDEERIRNRCKVTRQGSTKTATANDTGSQDSYGLRVQTYSNLLLPTSAAANTRATDAVHGSADPSVAGTVRAVLRVGMDYDRAVDLAVDAYEPLKWVTVKRGGVDESMMVDSCAVNYRVGGLCEFTYGLCPSAQAGAYWILGDATYGKLDETSFLKG